MRKGMFRLLLLLALSQVAASNPRSQVDEREALTTTRANVSGGRPVVVTTTKVAPAAGRTVVRDGRNRRIGRRGQTKQ
ncbi:MAG: hypothetical protein CSB47_10800 [Proteobacteria bacterium]|nr:MAG: hypothetical protein CSB47_10800 [Pseudomonadota bacterium]